MNTSLSNGLEEQTVIAKLLDIDYHRNFAAFGSVDTHYIIQVRPSTTSNKHSRFATFRYVVNAQVYIMNIEYHKTYLDSFIHAFIHPVHDKIHSRIVYYFLYCLYVCIYVCTLTITTTTTPLFGVH